MKKLTILLIVIALNVQSYGQDPLFVLHPLVGDTIDRNEKLNYLLFPQITDSDFKYCTLTHSEKGYFVNTTKIDCSSTVNQADSTEINQTRARLDKVVAYYLNQEQNDSIKNAHKEKLELLGQPSNFKMDNIVGEDTKERIFKEVRSENRMKDDAERFENNKQGTDLFGSGAQIQFFKRRKQR